MYKYVCFVEVGIDIDTWDLKLADVARVGSQTCGCCQRVYRVVVHWIVVHALTGERRESMQRVGYETNCVFDTLAFSHVDGSR